jgi:hypothetical protein
MLISRSNNCQMLGTRDDVSLRCRRGIKATEISDLVGSRVVSRLGCQINLVSIEPLTTIVYFLAISSSVPCGSPITI